MSLNSVESSLNMLSASLIEELQRIAPDKFFIVGEQNLIKLEDEKYDIKYNHKEGVLACFANQWEKIESFLEENDSSMLPQIKDNITILDLGEIRKGNNKKLFGKDLEEDLNLQLISGGSMNLLTSSKGNKHLVLTTRDGGNVDKGGLTGVAGRCETSDLDKESLKEFVEEGSYLGYLNGELHLVIPSVAKDQKEIRKFIERFLDGLRRNAIDNTKSTIGFFSKKYKPEDEKLEKLFNKNFIDREGDLNYSNLKEKLEEVFKTGRILFYDINEDKSKYNAEIEIQGKKYKGFVFDDKDNRTTEFRKVYDIDLSSLKDLSGNEIEEKMSYIGRLKRPSTMYLESEIQESRTINLSHEIIPLYDRLVPAIKEFIKYTKKRVNKQIEK